MKIYRVINGVEVEIELTTFELLDAYDEAQEVKDIDWCRSLLREYYFDVDRISDDDIYDLAVKYRNCLDWGDKMGIAEHDAFETAVMDYDFPEVEGNVED